MALKFLNKKGWHTGSLRNIENVWKAEQKHGAEQKKLDELRKQIQEEKGRNEFRLLQEQAGLVPRQERLEFLYDSGLSVGKSSSSDGFKALEAPPKPSTTEGASSSASASAAKQPSVPGALFEDKPQSANDAWRKLHSDPLLMIRQREQEALARVKNNPVQMAMIRKSVEAQKRKEKSHDRKKKRKKHRHSSSKHEKYSSSNQESDSKDNTTDSGKRKASWHKSSKYDDVSYPEDELGKCEVRNEKNHYRSLDFERIRDMSDRGRDPIENQTNLDDSRKGRESRSFHEKRSSGSTASTSHESIYKQRNVAQKLSEEERAARLREMQMDAEVHEEQRWKRLKKAEEEDAKEATRSSKPGGKNFLDAAQKSVYGAEKGGSSTIEESVRRRAYYSQSRSEASDRNAFRR